VLTTRFGHFSLRRRRWYPHQVGWCLTWAPELCVFAPISILGTWRRHFSEPAIDFAAGRSSQPYPPGTSHEGDRSAAGGQASINARVAPAPYSMANDTSPRHIVSTRRLLPLGLLAAAWIAFMLAGGYRYLNFAELAENRDWLCNLVQHWGFLAAFVYIAIYGVLIALSVPGAAVLTIAGGFLFGTWIGAVCAVIGATLGATALFLAARAGLGGLAQRAGRFVGRLEAGFRVDAFNYLLALRLVPIFPFWLVNLVPALVGVSLPTFILATFLGIIPGSVVYASLGNGLGGVVEEPDLAIVFKPRVLFPIVGLALLALIPVGYKRWRNKRSR
jgi:uncharacterized membrane protein YdjX (TVP38/TMEM64 family)